MIFLLRALPPSLRAGLARLVAWAAWSLGVRRRVALDNLAHAFPEKPEAERKAIARGAYRTMALAAVESIASDLSADTVVCDSPAWPGLEATLRAHQPVLIASAHFGSWESFAAVMARRQLAYSAVVRPLRGAFNARVVRAREQAGVELILQRGAMKGILSALKRGRGVVQLIDQSLPADHGVFVPFFGRPTCTTPSLSVAAKRTGAPVYVVMAAREATGLRMIVEGPIPLRDGDTTAHTAALTAAIERVIRQYPDQWLWLHRRWKVQPPPKSIPAGPRPSTPPATAG